MRKTKEAAKVKINQFDSCEECITKHPVHSTGGVMAIDCLACLGGETVRIYRGIIDFIGKNGVFFKVAQESEAMMDIIQEGGDRHRLIRQVAWMESALDLLKLSEDIFEEVEQDKKEVLTAYENPAKTK